MSSERIRFCRYKSGKRFANSLRCSSSITNTTSAQESCFRVTGFWLYSPADLVLNRSLKNSSADFLRFLFLLQINSTFMTYKKDKININVMRKRGDCHV